MVRTTVVIPMHDAADTVEHAVRSVRAQRDGDWELVVVDDGSVDGSAEIVRLIDDPRIRLVAHERNRGISAARNTGLTAARGEFVAFLDADDVWSPDFLETMHERRVEAGADAVVCGRVVVTPGGAPREEHSPRLGAMTGSLAAERMMTGEITPFPWDKLIRRTAFEGVTYPEDVKRFEDQVVGVIALSRTDRVVSIPDALVRYHIAAGSLTWGRVPRLEEAELALAYLEESLGRWLDPPSRRGAYLTCRTMFFLLTAQSAMRGSDRTAASAAVNRCRAAITVGMVLAALRRRPLVGAAAVLLKLAPVPYRRIFMAYVKRRYSLG